jgi:hypothetical protein
VFALEVRIRKPPNAVNQRRRRQCRMNRFWAGYLNPTLRRTEKEGHHTDARDALECAYPIASRAIVSGTVPDEKTVIHLGRSEVEVPTKVLLPRVLLSVDAEPSQLLYKPTSNIVTEAAIVDEVRLALSGVECGAPEHDVACDAHSTVTWSNDPAQAQPPERDVACNDDVRVSINGQLEGAAAVACSALFGPLNVPATL